MNSSDNTNFISLQPNSQRLLLQTYQIYNVHNILQRTVKQICQTSLIHKSFALVERDP